MKYLSMKNTLISMFVLVMMFLGCDSTLSLNGDQGIMSDDKKESEDMSKSDEKDSDTDSGLYEAEVVPVSNIELEEYDTQVPDENQTQYVKENVVLQENTNEINNEGIDRLIVISFDNNDIIVGETVSFNIILDDSNITESTTWSSSDESVLKNEGKGKFKALGVGSSNITINYMGYSKTIKLSVHVRPEIIGGDRYSSLLLGLENCSNNVDNWYVEFNIGSGKYYCNGDCDDAYLAIYGEDITVGFYNNKLYLVSNKDQNITFTSFTHEYTEWGNRDHINYNSKLSVNIKDRDNKVLRTEDFVIFPNYKSHEVLTEKVIPINKGSSIDITSYYYGTYIQNGKCPAIADISTLLTKKVKNEKQAGYWFIKEGTTRSGAKEGQSAIKYQSIRVK